MDTSTDEKIHICPYCKGKEKLPILAKELGLKKCPACGGCGMVSDWYYKKYKKQLSGFLVTLDEWKDVLWWRLLRLLKINKS